MNSLTVDNAAKGAQKTVVTIININEKDVDFLTQYFSTLMYSVCANLAHLSFNSFEHEVS